MPGVYESSEARKRATFQRRNARKSTASTAQVGSCEPNLEEWFNCYMMIMEAGVDRAGGERKQHEHRIESLKITENIKGTTLDYV